jgi:F-type H+-transporting ATPase subunit epsilon
MSNTTLNLTIIDAEKKIFEGEVKALSSYNDDGPFDILPYHANFISIIKKKLIVHLLNGDKNEYPIEVAVLKSTENKITVFFGIESFTFESTGSESNSAA